MTRALPFFAAALFAAQFAIADVVMRGKGSLAEPRALLSIFASVALWGLVASLAARPLARVVGALAAASILVVQGVVYRYYHVPLDGQVIESALHCSADVRPIVVRAAPGLLLGVAAVFLGELVILRLASARPVQTKIRWALAGALFVGLAFGPKMSDATPDLRLADAARRPEAHAGTGKLPAVNVPLLPSSKERIPSVLFIINESVRAADYCSAKVDDCAVAPEVNALLPNRVPLHQMRTISSYTAVSISALITGRTQEGTLDEIARAPNVFDFGRSVRRGKERPFVAYWSAQAETLFERKDIEGSVSSFVSIHALMGRHIDDEDAIIQDRVDDKLAKRVGVELDRAPLPLFAVVHLAGTHAPYFVDPNDAPFEPWERVVTWSKLPKLYNAYKNAIRAQDKSLAAMIRAFLDKTRGAPSLIVMTSDHGEAFGEHSAIHHGQNLYDEQSHVPGFIAWEGGALTAREIENLRAWSSHYATQLDLLPTVLDAWGVLDHVAIEKHRNKMPGRSLLRPPEPMKAPLPVTNCTAMFPCALDNWGMMKDGYLIFAQPWDYGWNCVDLANKNDRAPADTPACVALVEASKRVYPKLPNKRSNQ